MIDTPQIIERLAPYMAASPDKVRDRIIAGAKARFLADGFARVPVEDLCHQLRISKKTFYKHFRDKSDLVHAIVADNFREIVPRVVGVLTSGDPPDVRLHGMMDTVLNVVTKRISTVFVADMQALIPDLWNEIDDFRKAYVIPNMLRIFAEGQAAGVFRTDIDARVWSRILYLVITRVADPKILYENEISFESLVSTLFTVVRFGIEVRPDPPEVRP